MYEYDELTNENPIHVTSSLATNTIDSEMVGERAPRTLN